jgi:predicted dehydrogenase
MAVKVAVVGTGGIARRHGEALVENENAEIVGAVDVDSSRAEAFAGKYGGKAYSALGDCLNEVDAVYVLTPPSFRRQYALEAIEAGKHVFCEKPLAIAPEDGKAIAEAAQKKGVIAMTGFNQRYRKGYRKLKDVVASGALGNVYHFWCHRFGMGAGGNGQVRQGNWRTNADLCCGMTVESLSHDIDLMRWILDDEAVTVTGHVHSTVAALPNFDNNAHVLIKMKQGASAIINASWSSRIGVNSRGVLGERGTAFVEGTDVGNNGIWCSTRFHVKTDEDEYERVEMLHDNLDVLSYKAETDDFIDAITNGRQPLVSAQDGYETLRISQAILESSEKGESVHLS